MGDRLVKALVRSLFLATSRQRSVQQTRRILSGYLRLSERIAPEDGRRPVAVPPMPGVDEEMRNWSFFMILEHNAIVSRSISAMVQQLARGERPSGAAVIDPKKDVMPTPDAGPETLPAMQDAVHAHLERLARLSKLRGTLTARHPVFGEFDAHKWNCMFAFHMRIHYKQAAYVMRAVSSAPDI